MQSKLKPFEFQNFFYEREANFISCLFRSRATSRMTKNSRRSAKENGREWERAKKSLNLWTASLSSARPLHQDEPDTERWSDRRSAPSAHQIPSHFPPRDVSCCRMVSLSWLAHSLLFLAFRTRAERRFIFPERWRFLPKAVARVRLLRKRVEEVCEREETAQRLKTFLAVVVSWDVLEVIV